MTLLKPLPDFIRERFCKKNQSKTERVFNVAMQDFAEKTNVIHIVR